MHQPDVTRCRALHYRAPFWMGMHGSLLGIPLRLLLFHVTARPAGVQVTASVASFARALEPCPLTRALPYTMSRLSSLCHTALRILIIPVARGRPLRTEPPNTRTVSTSTRPDGLQLKYRTIRYVSMFEFVRNWDSDSQASQSDFSSRLRGISITKRGKEIPCSWKGIQCSRFKLTADMRQRHGGRGTRTAPVCGE